MAFKYSKVFKMENLPEIHTIDIGNDCFTRYWWSIYGYKGLREVSMTSSMHNNSMNRSSPSSDHPIWR